MSIKLQESIDLSTPFTSNFTHNVPNFGTLASHFTYRKLTNFYSILNLKISYVQILSIKDNKWLILKVFKGGKAYDYSKFNIAKKIKLLLNSFIHKHSEMYLINIEEIISAESERISKLLGKSFLDCDDIIKLTGLGRDNVRELMRSRLFPVITVGKRKVVSIVAFVTWQMNDFIKRLNQNG